MVSTLTFCRAVNLQRPLLVRFVQRKVRERRLFTHLPFRQVRPEPQRLERRRRLSLILLHTVLPFLLLHTVLPLPPLFLVYTRLPFLRQHVSPLRLKQLPKRRSPSSANETLSGISAKRRSSSSSSSKSSDSFSSSLKSSESKRRSCGSAISSDIAATMSSDNAATSAPRKFSPIAYSFGEI